MKRAVVLGAHGFVGRHTSRALAAIGYEVTGLGHGAWQSSQWQNWGMDRWHSCDISTTVLLEYAGSPDLIVQCAGSGLVAFSLSNPAEDFARSVGSTLATLEFIRVGAPDCRMILPSSAAVYGNAEQIPIPVTAPLRPASPYGVHKQIAEELCRSYARSFGVKVALVRLFSVYGTGLRKQLLWDACSKLTGGDARFGGTGEERRDWLHVEDAARLLAEAGARADATCPVVNGGTGEATSVRTIVEMLATALGIGDSPSFSGNRRGGDPTDYQADHSEALAWGWQPHRSLTEGLNEYVRWYRSEQS